MKHEIDLSLYSIRTDLVIDTITQEQASLVTEKKTAYDAISVSEVNIDSKNSALLGKKEGKYITIKFEDVTDHVNRANLIEVVTQELRELLDYLHIAPSDKCFVVGLGNRNSTPDALGPKTLDQCFITKYLFDMEGAEVEPGIRNVSGFVPGVMGSTGIESSDVILGIVEKTKPDFILAIDALASSSMERLSKTIQMTDTGIHPGSGVGNSRKEISQATIGIPVIAIGIPMVVDLATIVSDTIHYFLRQMSYNKENYSKGSHKLTPVTARNYLKHQEHLSKEEKEKLLGMVGTLSEEAIKSLMFEVLTPIGFNMMVTPKEVDFVVDYLSEVLGKSINQSLHTKSLSN